MFHLGKIRFRAVTGLASILFLAVLSRAGDSYAAFSSTRTDWSNFFGADGYIISYTYLGGPISDHETSSDPSNGGTGVSPDPIDLASGSPGASPGPYETPFYGYYNGGTLYDPDDPATMMDDYVMFRMRIAGDPSLNAGFKSYHWNVLLDVDRDGYKEYWVDMNGPYASGKNRYDQLQILYNNDSTQLIDDPDASRVEEFRAYNTADANNYSHTRIVDCADGTGDYFLDSQVPITAFKDSLGNQVLYPDSPVGFVFSTGASNQDPLQKDWMMDLGFLSTNDPIRFGDVIKAQGEPDIYFADSSLSPVTYYTVGDDIYLYNHYPFANTSSTTVDTLSVTVTSPVTGDDEVVTLVETGPNTGIFSNRGGANKPTSTNMLREWIPFVTTSTTTINETWTATRLADGTWAVSGSVSGNQGTATAGTAYTSPNGRASFTIYTDGAQTGDTITFTTTAADRLTSSSSGGSDNDGDLQVVSGETIYFSYTTPQSKTYVTSAGIVGPGEPFIHFTRSNGLVCEAYEINFDQALSDPLYVTVYHSDANTDPNTVQTIQVVLSGLDGQTLTLTETGPNTGAFRNTTGLPTKVSDGNIGLNDGLWEDVDQGVVTASYTYGGQTYTETADLFYTSFAGRVNFTNGAGTVDVHIYTMGQPIFVRMEDKNWQECDAISGVQVTVTSDTGDSENVTLYQTATGSGVYMNRVNDLVTTAGQPEVSSATTNAFLGVQTGDPFIIATGPDVGTYEVLSVQDVNNITLTPALTSDRTGIGYNARPLLTDTYNGSYTADDGVLEAIDQDSLTVTYDDCNDGDLDPNNNDKTDTAAYNSPSIVINQVLFYPDGDYAQTEFVQIYNNATTAIEVTGYRITDSDAFSCTIPQLDGSNISLQPGQRLYVLLYNRDMPSLNYYDSTTNAYYIFANGGSDIPTNQLGGPDDADPADQILLYNVSGTVIDYVGWSSTTSNSVDFQSDDSPAVTRNIWSDDAFKNTTGINVGYGISRISDGFDTNQPSDWIFTSTSSLWDVTGPIITQATVVSFEALTEGGRVVLSWRTASESGTLGFHLYRLLEDSGGWLKIDRSIVPGVLQPPLGGTYHCLDQTAEPGATYTYRLEEIEAGGRRFFYGPFQVSAKRAVTAPIFNGSAWRRTPGLASHARRRAVVKTAPAGRSRPDRIAQSRRIKIPVLADGIHYLGAAEIAALTGLPQIRVAQLLLRGGFRLTNRGKLVAYHALDGGEGLVFYGQALKNLYSDENIYILSPVMGQRMQVATGRPARPTAGGSFLEQRHLEEDRWDLPGFFEDPEYDYWYWDFFVAGEPPDDSRTYTVRTPGVSAAADTASLTISLQGLTDTPAPMDHHLRITLNGFTIGDCWWDGAGRCDRTFTFKTSILQEGDNQLGLTALLDTGAEYSIFFLDSFDIAYRRSFRAEGNVLAFRAPGRGTITIGGFTSPDILIFDISSPRQPVLIGAPPVLGQAGDYSLSFTPTSRRGSYVAVAGGSFTPVAGARPDYPSQLKQAVEGADYVVITRSDLLEAAGELAAYRGSQGLATMVVNLEDIMDEFNNSLYNPWAIRDFLAWACRNWIRRPRYVLLAGNGTYDYRDRLGWGDNLVPTVMVGTGKGLAASDNSLADVAGNDGVPDIAIGRLPVLTADELLLAMAKIATQENLGVVYPDRPILLLADNPDAGGSFTSDSELLAASLPPDKSLTRIYLSELTLQQARSLLFSSLASGASFVNFFGHAGLDRLAQEGLIKTTDLGFLQSPYGLPVMTTMTCVVGMYDFPGLDTLGELLVLDPTAGAAAFWGPSGFSNNEAATVLDRVFYNAVFQGGQTLLGDAVLQGLRDYAAGGNPAFMISIYNLLGDPAFRLR